MKIPPQAKRVFKGVIFDVYQWEQEMYDGSYETFEMLKRPDTVEIIAVAGDKILICEQSQPMKSFFYSLPGGRQDEGEKLLDTVKRELLEETGYVSDEWELFKSFDPYNKMEWTVYTYIARNCQKAGEQNLDSGEKIKLKLVGFDEFLDIVNDEKFYGRELSQYLFRLGQDMEKRDEFKRKLFKNF